MFAFLNVWFDNSLIFKESARIYLIVSVKYVLKQPHLLANDDTCLVLSHFQEIVKYIFDPLILGIHDHHFAAEIDNLQLYLVITFLNVATHEPPKGFLCQAGEPVNEFLEQKDEGGLSPPGSDLVNGFNTVENYGVTLNRVFYYHLLEGYNTLGHYLVVLLFQLGYKGL